MTGSASNRERPNAIQACVHPDGLPTIGPSDRECLRGSHGQRPPDRGLFPLCWKHRRAAAATRGATVIRKARSQQITDCGYPLGTRNSAGALDPCAIEGEGMRRREQRYGFRDYRAAENPSRGKQIVSRSGYFFSRSHSTKMIHRITSSAIQSQLPSGPTLPPVSQAGPAKAGLNR